MRLRTGLLAALAYVLLLAIVALGVPLGLSLSARVHDEVRSQAQGQADLVAATAADLLTPAHHRDLMSLARTSAVAVRGRVLVANRAGIVLADSATPPELGESYARRPEIASALRGRRVQLQRPSRTLEEEILATAAPVIRNRRTAGAVRVTQSVAAVHAAITRVELGLALIGAVVLAVGLAVGVVIAGQIARPLGRLERVARRVASGDLSARATIEGSREQRSLGASFNEMTGRLQGLLGSQRAFVADASHQLRTPLTGLRLRIEEARAAGVSPAVGGELDAGIAELDRLAQIVEELLVLSRAGEREQPGERLDLRETVERALGRWRASATEREIALEQGELEDGAAWCAAADADRVLDVLLENALRYAPRGSHVVVAGASGSIEIRDRGPGLSAEDGESIFERFHRGSAGANGPSGSGLGLAIARELAHEWGGEVTLRNRADGGAIGTLTLPKANGATRYGDTGRDGARQGGTGHDDADRSDTGCAPATEWLRGSGLGPGAIPTDATGRTTLAGVYAGGDAACWPDPYLHTLTRPNTGRPRPDRARRSPTRSWDSHRRVRRHQCSGATSTDDASNLSDTRPRTATSSSTATPPSADLSPHGSHATGKRPARCW